MNERDVRAIRTEELPEEPFPEVAQSFRVLLSEDAFDRAIARGQEEADREIGGILVGRLLRDAGGPYVRVETTIDALHAREESTELTFTHETWSHVHEVMDRDHPDLRIVGWYHTHPGFGIFLSDRDEFIHRSFFDLPHQIALVHDPKSREHGVFVWRDGEPVRARRYWIGTAEQTWEPPAAPGPKPTKTVEPDPAARSGSTAPEGSPALDRGTLGIGAVILLLLGGVLGYWLGGGARGPSLEQRQREVLAAKAAGAEELARRLDLEVLELLRRSLDGRTAARAEQALARLDAAVEALAAGDPPPDEKTRKERLAEVEAAAGAVRALLDARLGAAATLEKIARHGSSIVDPETLRQLLGLHSALLGEILSGLATEAENAGDPDRARLLLRQAMLADPGRAKRYRERLEALGPARGEEDGR